MKYRQLLCTFSNKSSYKEDVRQIGELYPTKKIKYFIFKNDIAEKEVYITYNIEISSTFEKYPSTISIHRKKETNTLYTLNSLNKLVIDECGELNKNYQIEWNLYKNCFILTHDIGVRIINIELIEII